MSKKSSRVGVSLSATAVCAAAVIAFVLTASYDVALPGLYYDELIQVVPSLAFVKGGLPSRVNALPATQIELFGRPLPLMTMDYMGAVKTVAFTPIAAAFGVTPASVRGFTIAVGALALVVTFAFARRLCGNAAAAVAVLLLASDPGYIFYTRADFAPTAMMMLFKAVALWQLAIWWQSGRRAALSIACMALGLGVYDKANFMWIVGALAVAAAAVGARGLTDRIRSKDAAVAGGSFVVGASPLIWSNLSWPPPTLAALWGPAVQGGPPGGPVMQLLHRIGLLMDLLDGRATGRLLGADVSGWPVLSVMAALAATWVVVEWFRGRHGVRPAAFVLLAGWWILVAAALTPGGYAAHHVILAYPFPHLLVAMTVVWAACAAQRRVVWASARMPALVMCGLTAAPVAANGATVAAVFDHLRATGGDRNWSDAVYALNAYLLEDPDKPLVVLDWGLHFNLVALSQGRLRSVEVWPALNNAAGNQALLTGMFVNFEYRYVLHAPAATNFPLPRQHFLQAATNAPHPPVLQKRFTTRDGNPVFEVYTVPQQAALHERAAAASAADRCNSIAAEPNPVVVETGLGTTKLTWCVEGTADAEVYVSGDSGPEKLFARGTRGSGEAPWIRSGARYEFRLYADRAHQILLASTLVTGTSAPSASVVSGSGTESAARVYLPEMAPSRGRRLAALAALLALAIPLAFRVLRRHGRSVERSPIRTEDAWCVLIAVFVIAAAWTPLALSDKSLLVLHDASEQTYPWWQYSVAEIQRGTMPLWDPYTGGGTTHVGEGQQGVFYPPFVVLAAVGGSWASTTAAIHVFAFMHALLAWGGAYLLARVLGLRGLEAFGTGLTFALGGFFSLRALGQLNIYYATAWVPLVVAGPFLVLRRCDLRWSLLSGAALALSLLAGHAQPAFHGGLAFGLVALWLCVSSPYEDRSLLGVRRAALMCGLAVTSACAFSAVQLLPMVEYQHLALRWVGTAEPVAADARISLATLEANPSFHVQKFPTALFAHVGTVEDGSLYIGTAAFLLAVLGSVSRPLRRRAVWITLFVLGLLLSLGSATPALKIAYALLPLSDRIRAPVRHLLLAHLSASVLVGMGLARMTSGIPSGGRERLGIAAGAVTVACAIGVVAASQRPSSDVALPLLGGGLAAILVVVLLLWPRRRASSRSRACAALVTLAAIELSVAWTTMLPPVAPSGGSGNVEVRTYFGSELAEGVHRFVQQHPGLYRMDFTDSPIPANFGEILRMPTVNRFSATLPRRFHEFRSTLGFLPPDRGPDILGTRYLLSRRPLDGVQKVGQIGVFAVYENRSALPLAWVVEEAELVADDHAVLATLKDPSWQPRRSAVVTADQRSEVSPCQRGGDGIITRTDYTPEMVRVHVHNRRPSLVTTSDPDYPGWIATVDGRRFPVVRANYAFRAVCAPAGEHVVEFRYVPTSVRFGALVTVVSMVVVVGGLARRYRTTRGQFRGADGGRYRTLRTVLFRPVHADDTIAPKP